MAASETWRWCPEPLEERRKRLAKLLSRKTKAMRDGIQLSQAITGDGARIFRHACWMDLEGIVSKRIGSRYGSGRTRAWLKTKREVDGQDMRPEPLEERRRRLAKLLSRSNKAMRDGIQLSEVITGNGAAIFRHACWMGLEGIVSKRIGSRYVGGRTRAWLTTKNLTETGGELS